MIDEKRCVEFPKIDELVAFSIKENCRRLRSEIIKFSALQKLQRQEVLDYEQRKEHPHDG